MWRLCLQHNKFISVLCVCSHKFKCRRRRLKNRTALSGQQQSSQSEWGTQEKMNTTEQPPQRQRLTEVCRLCSTIHESGLVGAATATGEQPGRRFNSVIEAVEKHLHIQVSRHRDDRLIPSSSPSTRSKCCSRLFQIEPENGICNFCFCFVRKLRDFSEHCQKVDKMFQMASNLAKDEHSLTDWDEIRTICEIVSIPFDTLLLHSQL